MEKDFKKSLCIDINKVGIMGKENYKKQGCCEEISTLQN